MKSKSTYEQVLHALADYFTFSRLHRRGSLFLLLLNLILASGFYFIHYLKRPESSFDSTPFREELERFQAAMEKSRQAAAASKKNEAFMPDPLPGKPFTESKPAYFRFDPNTLSLDGFRSLGLSEKQAAVLLRYREKGGTFRNKADLKKMYCISPEKYADLEPYISIAPDTVFRRSEIGSAPPGMLTSCRSEIVDLNTSSAADLDSIRGIGPAIANGIIRYREKLGGYRSLEQLREVYGIDSNLYRQIIPCLRLETVSLTRININTGFADDLKHPYLDRGLARLIVNYRKLHGAFGSVEDLKKLALVNEELYLKLAPYLTTE